MARIEPSRTADGRPGRRRSSAPMRSRASSARKRPIVTITDTDGAIGTGYSYTIGTGGSSVMRLLRDHLAPRLIGREADEIEAIWRDLEFVTHATTVGAITSLALAAIDTALWDLRAQASRACRCGSWPAAPRTAARSTPPRAAGCTSRPQALVEDALAAKAKGFRRLEGQDRQAAWLGGLSRRLSAVREAVGDGFEIMTDCQSGLPRRRGDPPRRAAARARPRLVRGAAAGRRYRRPCPACRARPRRRSRSAKSLYSIRPFPRIHAAGRLLASCRSMSAASAASRPG